jgi:signal transduction histidine kinase
MKMNPQKSILQKLEKMTGTLLVTVSLLFVLLMGIQIVTSTLFTFAGAKKQIQAYLVSKGVMLVINNGRALVTLAEDNAFSAIEMLVKETVEGDSDVVFGTYLDKELRSWTLSMDSIQGISTALSSDTVFPWAASCTTATWRQVNTSSGTVFLFANPVVGEDGRLGTVCYGLQTQAMKKMIKEMLHVEILRSLMYLIIIVFVIMLIVKVQSKAVRHQAHQLTEPIALLTTAASAIAAGDHDSPVAIISDDEIGVLATNFDIMRQKVKEYTDTLEQKVKQRTQELDAALRELKRSNTELEQFAYIASHDLQEPLRMVTSYLQLLKRRYDSKIDNEGQEFIAYAVDGAARMRQLIVDLLAYSRVGTKGKEFVPIQMQQVFDKATRNLQIALEERGAVVTHDDALPGIVGDEGQLIQLIQNLVGNASKFCKDRKPLIHFGAVVQDDGWLFSVRDNGIGIAPEYFDRVFQIFQRLHSREEFEGTGIGLAVCKKIVERHHGRIWVESVQNEGTTFFFTIPQIALDSQAEAAEAV